MMNTTTGPFGPQMTSGVAVNASTGFGNYNGGFASVKMADWKGLTMQTNFTWSKALGTGGAGSGHQRIHCRTILSIPTPCMAGRLLTASSSTTRSSCTSLPFFKGQHGLAGRALGGWTFSSIFTAGTGTPIEIFTTTGDGQEYGAGDNVNFFGDENAVPIGPVKGGHAYYNRPSSGLPVNFFAAGPAAINSFRNPILGLDNRDGGYWHCQWAAVLEYGLQHQEELPGDGGY